MNVIFINKLLGAPFPRNFFTIARDIMRRLFRVYAHIYNHHFEVIVALGIEAHLNTNYRHFLLFINQVMRFFNFISITLTLNLTFSLI